MNKDNFWQGVVDLATALVVAMFIGSWIYVAINGSSSGPSSWGERYETRYR